MVADIVREGALTAQSKGHMHRGPSGMPEHVGSRSRYCSAGSGWCTLEPHSMWLGPVCSGRKQDGSILTVESCLLAAVCKSCIFCESNALDQ